MEIYRPTRAHIQTPHPTECKPTCTCIQCLTKSGIVVLTTLHHVYIHVHVLMKDEEERKKEASKIKQITKQSNTAHPRQSLFLRKMRASGSTAVQPSTIGKKNYLYLCSSYNCLWDIRSRVLYIYMYIHCITVIYTAVRSNNDAYTKEIANFPAKLSLLRTRNEPLPPLKSCRMIFASLREIFPWYHLCVCL